MESDRKYRQRGYQDTGRDQPSREQQKPKGLRPPLDVTGPRLPRLVQAVTAARCWNCSTTLPTDIDFAGVCPKCNSALHVCKQCAHFEPSTRFQCVKPVPERIAYKDKANECTLFKPSVTVARDSAGSASQTGGPSPSLKIVEPRTAHDARAAFDNLFKK